MQETDGLRKHRARIDERLAALLPNDAGPLKPLHEAMRYSCLAPGKRIRPALCLVSAEAVGGSVEDALDAACAIEMVHAFSLIHDDLPAIDNDDLRRGRPTCHKQFGEAVAILAGDALFALAFEVVAASSAFGDRSLAATLCLAKSVGSNGVVGGEVVDILSEGSAPTAEGVQFIHARKTGALIAASCAIGAIMAGAPASVVADLEGFGADIGLAFQIADDLLNETSTPEKLGKSTGSDRERQKATYPAVYGLDASRQAAKSAVERGLGRLSGLSSAADPLRDLAHFSVERLV